MMSNLEETIGYQFNDNELLEQALSHSSYANESKETRASNERLEFLGDSVLSLVVSQYIEHFRKLPEGSLRKCCFFGMRKGTTPVRSANWARCAYATW